MIASRCVGALSCLVALTAPLGAAAQGAFPEPPRIVHTLSPIGGQETWLVETRLGANEPRRLFAVPHRVGGAPIPALSPDGRWIAYTAVADFSTPPELVLVDLLGGASRTLARNVVHTRPVFDRFGLEVYASRVQYRAPPRPSRPSAPLAMRPAAFQLIALSVANGTERVLLSHDAHDLVVIGVSQRGEVLVHRQGPRDAAILALDPQDGRSRVVLSLGQHVAADVSLSPIDDRLLLSRSTDTARRRWEIVLCGLDGTVRVLRRERHADLAPTRVGQTVMFADVRGSPLRTIDLRGRELPRARVRETQTRHRVIASTPDGRITIMRRDTPEGTGFVALDREASFALPLTEGGVLVDVAGFR